MDCREFDKLAAEYAEGLLDQELRAQMEAHRDVCPLCDELARVSESVLLALNEAPRVKAPAGFSGRVLASVALEQKRIAREQAAYRRMVQRGLALVGSLPGICSTAWYFWFGNAARLPLEQATANLESNWFGRWFEFFQASGRLMNTPVALPGFESGAPALYVGAGVMFAGTMLWLWLYQRRTVGCTI
jgi:hypothetical protein